jgi:hypothetical protein
MQSLEVVARIGEETGFEVSPEYVFAYPTVREFAAQLDALGAVAR